jgi:hypothetical protein
MIGVPDGEEPATEKLLRPQDGSHRFGWSSDESVEFHVPHGELINLLHSAGFEIENLPEIQAPGGATTRFPHLTPEWARRWPAQSYGSLECAAETRG